MFFISFCGLWCFKATFNNISAITWQSVVLVQETGVPEETSQTCQTLSHNVVSRTDLAMNGV
jgi:hypothetical protein